MLTQAEIELKKKEIAAVIDTPGVTQNTRTGRSYQDFLLVCWYLYRSGTSSSAAVSLSADEGWHTHMQDGDYPDDCRHIFEGHVLQHVEDGQDPSPEDAARVLAAYDAVRLPRPPELRAKCVWAIVA